ncbi:MAG: hypothetical protein ACTSRB_18240 [Candidatus Helarchaeota archaeon]
MAVPERSGFRISAYLDVVIEGLQRDVARGVHVGVDEEFATRLSLSRGDCTCFKYGNAVIFKYCQSS